MDQMDALPSQPDTPASNVGWGEDPWRGQNVAFMNTPTSPANNAQSNVQAPAQASAFPVNFNDAFQQQVQN